MAISIRLRNARANDRRLKAFRVRLAREIAAAEHRTARRAWREAIRLSSGTLTARDRRRLGYPYARKWGGARVPGDPAIINQVRGVFRRSWRVDGPRVINDSDVAGYLSKGTRKMILRPTRERIIERTWVERRDNLRDAVRRAGRH